jgi:hypothetical protein
MFLGHASAGEKGETIIDLYRQDLPDPCKISPNESRKVITKVTQFAFPFPLPLVKQNIVFSTL